MANSPRRLPRGSRRVRGRRILQPAPSKIPVSQSGLQGDAPGDAGLPRVAPAIVGMGLLEAIPGTDILASADPDDADGDGISGRANLVWNERNASQTLGRLGWKANQTTVEQQTAGAFRGDLGITSVISLDENCTEPQDDCLNAPNGGSPEISTELREMVVLYSQTLAVPAMRDVDGPQEGRPAHQQREDANLGEEQVSQR